MTCDALAAPAGGPENGQQFYGSRADSRGKANKARRTVALAMSDSAMPRSPAKATPIAGNCAGLLRAGRS